MLRKFLLASALVFVVAFPKLSYAHHLFNPLENENKGVAIGVISDGKNDKDEKNLKNFNLNKSDEAIAIGEISGKKDSHKRKNGLAFARANIGYWNGDYVVAEFNVNGTISSMLNATSSITLYDADTMRVLSSTTVRADSNSPTDHLSTSATMWVGNSNAVKISLNGVFVGTTSGTYTLAPFKSGIVHRN